jgi:MFS family permease
VETLSYLRQRRWAPVVGVGLFVSMMTVGYYYNVTFVQLGLLDLGTTHLLLPAEDVVRLMAVFAVVTCVASLTAGLAMTRLGWCTGLRAKLSIAAGVVIVQFGLTYSSAWIADGTSFTAWLLAAAVTIGVGIPATFGLAVDLVPVRDRGAVAGLITGFAYLAAPVASYPWTFEHLRAQMLPIMGAGAVAMVALLVIPNGLVEALGRQSSTPGFGIGRYSPVRRHGGAGVLAALAALMFGVFFIDSLGFLRLSEESAYMQGAWLSADLWVRVSIGLVHALGAWVAAVFYTVFDYRVLFAWAFGLFGLVHLLYTFPLRFGDSAPVLAAPMMYALAVSVYTVLNFALWADLSTPRTIARNSAIGVGLSGWTATFVSTSLALAWRQSGMDLDHHLRIVDSVAIVLFLIVIAALFFWPSSRRAAGPEAP